MATVDPPLSDDAAIRSSLGSLTWKDHGDVVRQQRLQPGN